MLFIPSVVINLLPNKGCLDPRLHMTCSFITWLGLSTAPERPFPTAVLNWAVAEVVGADEGPTLSRLAAMEAVVSGFFCAVAL